MMDNNNLPDRTVEDFFDNELRDYAIYTLEHRAIPSLCDGFKPSQRKIAYTATQVWKTGKEKPMKVFQLGGLAASMTMFHHGSLDGTIIGMTQDFKNSMSIFQGVGQFGSLRSPEAGAPRYVGVKFNKNFNLLYKDFELLEHKVEEGEKIEPVFFLPIIPTVLLNGGSGIAVGFATNILNRNPVDLINACLKVLGGENCPEVSPWINGFTGDFARVIDTPKSWEIRGSFQVKNTTTVEITELPPSFTYEKYETHLEALIDKGTLASYDDHSAEVPHYILKFKRTILTSLVKRSRLEKVLKLKERVGENYTTLDENGKLKIFESPEEIITYFVKFRLRYYTLRKRHLIQKLTRELWIAENRKRFIEEILSNNLQINNQRKSDIVDNLKDMEFKNLNGSYNYLLDMSIYNLTKEKAEELRKLHTTKTEELKIIEGKTSKEMYRKDLRELRQKLK